MSGGKGDAGTGGSIEALIFYINDLVECYQDRLTTNEGSAEKVGWLPLSAFWPLWKELAALLTRRDQPEPPAPRAWRDALADLVDVCYAEGSSPSWRVCRVCDMEHRPDEAMPGDRTHQPDCVVDAAEKLLTAWTASQSVSLATRRDAPPIDRPAIEVIRQSLAAGEYRNREDFGDDAYQYSAEGAIQLLLDQLGRDADPAKEPTE